MTYLFRDVVIFCIQLTISSRSMIKFIHFLHVMQILLNKAFIGSILIVVFSAYVFFKPIKSRGISQQQLLLIRADNAFYLQNYEQAQTYYAKALKTQSLMSDGDNTQLLDRYIKSLLLSPEKNLTSIINGYKKYLSSSDGIKRLNLNDVQQILALGMLDDVMVISDQLSDPLLKTVVLKDHDLIRAHMQLLSIAKELRDEKYYAVSAEIHFLQEDYDAVIDDTDQLLNNGFFDAQMYYYRAQAFVRTDRLEQSKTALNLYQVLESITSGPYSQRIEKIEQLIERFPSFANNTTIKVHYINALQSNAQSKKAVNELKLIEGINLRINDEIKIVKTAMRFQNDDVVKWMYEHSSISDKPVMNGINGNIVLEGLMCEYFVSTDQLIIADQVCDNAFNYEQHHAHTFYWSGELKLKQQDYPKAIQAKKIALDYAPWMREWRLKLAHIYLSQGEVKPARLLFNQDMINNDPSIKKFVFENGLIIHE